MRRALIALVLTACGADGVDLVLDRDAGAKYGTVEEAYTSPAYCPYNWASMWNLYDSPGQTTNPVASIASYPPYRPDAELVGVGWAWDQNDPWYKLSCEFRLSGAVHLSAPKVNGVCPTRYIRSKVEVAASTGWVGIPSYERVEKTGTPKPDGDCSYFTYIFDSISRTTRSSAGGDLNCRDFYINSNGEPRGDFRSRSNASSCYSDGYYPN